MGDLQIEKGSGAKPNATFYSDGVATNLDGACTVTLTKPDGTAGPASGTVTNIGTGKYEFTLGQQTEVIYYDITWAGTIGGVATSIFTRVEVVGLFLYSLAAMRAVKVAGDTPFANTTNYPNSVLLDRRAEVTDDFERRCGWSFIPRYARELKDGTGCAELLLDHRSNGAQKLLSVTVNGVAQQLSGYTLDRSGVLYATSNFLPTGWFQPGIANIAVEHVHGWARPPATLSSAGLARTAMLLLPSQVASTVSSWTTPDGTTYSYDQAGQSFAGGGIRHYGVPGIDSVLNQYAALGAFA